MKSVVWPTLPLTTPHKAPEFQSIQAQLSCRRVSHRYREDAAIWAFRETNRIAAINWDKTRKIIEPEMVAYERSMMASNTMVEDQAVALLKEGKNEEVEELLNQHTSSFAASVMARWRELKGRILEIFIRSM